MATLVYNIARPRKIPFCNLVHFSPIFCRSYADEGSILAYPSVPDVLWRRGVALSWVGSCAQIAQGGVG